jgi:hypothetical protein
VLNFGYILFVASITWLVLTGSRNNIYLWIFKQSLKLLLDFGIIKSLADQQYLNGTSYVVYHCIWPEMLSIVGCIDGTSHESYKPLVEDQVQFYSGYKRFHCFHTIVIITANNTFAYIRTGYLGHTNDQGCFHFMPNIGPGLALDFPPDAHILGDLSYANPYPILTQTRRYQ